MKNLVVLLLLFYFPAFALEVLERTGSSNGVVINRLAFKKGKIELFTNQGIAETNKVQSTGLFEIISQNESYEALFRQIEMREKTKTSASVRLKLKRFQHPSPRYELDGIFLLDKTQNALAQEAIDTYRSSKVRLVQGSRFEWRPNQNLLIRSNIKNGKLFRTAFIPVPNQECRYSSAKHLALTCGFKDAGMIEFGVRP